MRRRRTERPAGLLRRPGFRLYLGGHTISQFGDWMQSWATAWLVWELTHSAMSVGVAIGVRHAVTCVCSPVGGWLADHVAKRALLISALAMLAVTSAGLGLLTATGQVTALAVYVAAGFSGGLSGLTVPVRQSFATELAGPERAYQAASLSVVGNQAGRFIAPGAAVVITYAWGVGSCFLMNALTYLANLVAVWRIDGRTRNSSASRTSRRALVGLRHIADTPALWLSIVASALICNLVVFESLLTAIAGRVWGGTVHTYAWLTGATAAGALVGAVWAGLHEPRLRRLTAQAAALGVSQLLAALIPIWWSVLWLQLAALLLASVFVVSFGTGALATVQGHASEALRGRVLGMRSMVVAPFCTPLVGWLADETSPLVGLLVGACAAVAVALMLAIALARLGEFPSISPADGDRAGGDGG
jgi:MFS family permease